ncbi:hypothetical protein SAMN06265182_0806 [Persephonella hydrogeniphila]|uniref:Uncharacterized protein n=1 Tax=Persephonella hydrogeniphila TaxID=198703 RepID=A0A285NBK3_9AQUI|nr:hypothetical protein [Persephonella hydrogeniphila]SNZ06810.1 hypothetical protein SAMN06265182_0806 [Persephonella hydrogeniphila]
MGGKRSFWVFLFFLVEISCAAHSKVKPLPGSENITVLEAFDHAERVLFRLEKEKGCRIILKEKIIPPSAKEYPESLLWDKEIEIIGRNKAVKAGGNIVILEKFRPIREIKLEVKYTGKVIILKCP